LKSTHSCLRWVAVLTGLLAFFSPVSPLSAQESTEPVAVTSQPEVESDEKAIHEQLRTIRDQFISAVNSKDSDAVLALLHPRVVLTAQDGTKLNTVRGKDGVEDYLNRLLLGPEKGIESLKLAPKAEDLSELYNGDTAIAFGTSNDHYVTVKGNEFDLETRWSATLVKEGDAWLVANLHVSTNLFDNPVMAAAMKATTWIAIATGITGLVVGLLLGRRKRTA
jgi:ketosteroid isomerase-like protein